MPPVWAGILNSIGCTTCAMVMVASGRSSLARSAHEAAGVAAWQKGVARTRVPKTPAVIPLPAHLDRQNGFPEPFTLLLLVNVIPFKRPLKI
jgi:hypothetical protein